MTGDRDARIPVDRGWAWMVMVGSFVISTINIGTEKSFGIFFIEFLRQFKGTVFMTAMINTVWNVVFSITAASVLLTGFKRLSIRISVFLGITLSALGYGISSFATGLEYLLVSQSILIGMGAAFKIPPIYILIGDYFDKKKGIANAVFLSGNSFGGVIMPPLYRYVFDEYGLRGGLIITSGIIFNSLVAAALLRPTTFYTDRSPQKSSFGSVDNNSATTAKPDEENNDPSHPFLAREEAAKQSANADNTQTNDSNEAVDSAMEEKLEESNTDQSSHSGVVSNPINGYADSTLSVDQFDRNDGHEEKQCEIGEGCFVKCKNKIDCSLLKNVHFLLFLLIYCMGNVATMCAHIYIPTYARDIGIEDQRIAIIVSLYCVSDFVGRIVAGFLSDQKWITAEQIVVLSQIVVGVVLQFTVYYTSFLRLLVFVTILGSTAGMIIALFPPMMIDIVGRDRYPSAMAIFILWVRLFEGFAVPVLGYFRDINNTFHLSFHLMGATSFAAVGLLIIFFILKRKRSRDEDDEENT
ncbi:monocarboxylate transporter 12-B-like [Ylistrum balloti]|uniref:monocarboxylate transporter 12-B-like n=1 Tax=Ylistrum balloti TaxID=509963 RepID=UPI002905EC12|nr:monocarboxylate transporter 12-B-like [Ylistrum balloti]